MLPLIVRRALIVSIITLCLVLIWHYLVSSSQSLSFAFFTAGVILLAAAWINYLSIDGMFAGFRKRSGNNEKPAAAFDISDFTDTEIDNFRELPEEDKSCCRLAVNLLSAIIIFLLSLILR